MGPTKNKKRKLVSEPQDEVDTSKPTAVFQASQGRNYTLSIALPGSIIAKYSFLCLLPHKKLTIRTSAQSHDLKTTLAGQIARALAVFCVDEIVVFDDGQASLSKRSQSFQQHAEDGYTGYSDPNHFLSHLLSYLETPPHLRKHLFPLHPDLRTAGTLPSLDMPHHLRSHEWCQYREGVSFGPANGSSNVSHVDVGFEAPVELAGSIPEYARVTVKFPESKEAAGFQAGGQRVEPVAPSLPREKGGYYWGYQVRSAKSLSAVITECPFDGGYDLTWGTSERGRDLSEILHEGEDRIPAFKHMMVVFGGVAGLEVAAKADTELAGMGVTKPEELFDYWTNLHPGQGSRTIRTEEAVWLGLMGLRDVVKTHGSVQ